MKTQIAALAFILSLCANAFAVEERVLLQPLDHFSGSPETLEQRIQISRTDGVPASAPVLVFLGGEGPGIDVDVFARPFRYAAKTTPLIFVALEHRGYGRSFSKHDDQSVPDYVTVDQALADFHEAIVSLRKEFSGPFMVMGYSYSGGLAVHLGAKYPGDADVVLSSSGVLSWPFVFDSHDRRILEAWPASLRERVAKHAANLAGAELFSDRWKDLDFLQTGIMGIAQYIRYQAAIPEVDQAAALPTPTFIAALRQFDAKKAGGAVNEWSFSRSEKTISREQAMTGRYYGRFWAYQQCKEMGSFSVGADPNTVFVQTEDELRDFCAALFGARPTFVKIHDWTADVSTLNVPLIYIAGANDPWRSLGILDTKALPARSRFILVEDGFHAPDRELGYESVANEAIETALAIVTGRN